MTSQNTTSQNTELSVGQCFFKDSFGYICLGDWRLRGIYISNLPPLANKKNALWTYIKLDPKTKPEISCNDFGKVPLFQPIRPEPLPVVQVARWCLLKGIIRVICPTCERINTHNVSSGGGHRCCDRAGCFGYHLQLSTN